MEWWPSEFHVLRHPDELFTVEDGCRKNLKRTIPILTGPTFSSDDFRKNESTRSVATLTTFNFVNSQSTDVFYTWESHNNVTASVFPRLCRKERSGQQGNYPRRIGSEPPPRHFLFASHHDVSCVARIIAVCSRCQRRLVTISADTTISAQHMWRVGKENLYYRARQLLISDEASGQS